MVIEILIKLMVAIIALALAFVLGFGLWRLVEIPIRKRRGSTFDYVYVDDDGNARELNSDEEQFITTSLFPNHEADQVIKSSYNSLTYDGRLRGYLLRRNLPQRIPVGPAPQ